MISQPQIIGLIGDQLPNRLLQFVGLRHHRSFLDSQKILAVVRRLSESRTVKCTGW